MIILSETDVRQVFDMNMAFQAVREASIAYVQGSTTSPRRTALAPDEGGEFLVMPGAVGPTFATKIWYALGRPSHHIPESSALIALIDPELGHEVLIEGGLVTDLRTGAMTGLAAQHLAPSSATILTVLGAGIQARTQILALLHALDSLREVRVYSRSEDRRTRFCETLNAEVAGLGLGGRVNITPADDPGRACRGADVIVAATTSSVPVVRDEWVGTNTLVCSVGSHTPRQSELEVDTVARASRVAVDTIPGGVDGAGDIANAIAAGHLERDSVIELGHLLQSPRTAGGEELTVFKSVGFSAADVVAARMIARAALDQGLGTHVALRSGRQATQAI
jgi:ornithine cyclodeaminase/alanine dehydrogenase-like protein (mu-crystallin family)